MASSTRDSTWLGVSCVRVRPSVRIRDLDRELAIFIACYVARAGTRLGLGDNGTMFLAL